MPIVEFSFSRAEGSIQIERFWHTHKGKVVWQDGDAKYSKEKFYPARIMLEKHKSQFYIDWAANRMRELQDSSLVDLKKTLDAYMVELATGKSVDNIDSWDEVIFIHSESVERARVLRDVDGRIERKARWDEEKEQYVPDEHFYRGSGHNIIPFDKAEFARLERAADALEEFEGARQAMRIGGYSSKHERPKPHQTPPGLVEWFRKATKKLRTMCGQMEEQLDLAKEGSQED